MRQTINDWIRTTKDLDGVADFDKIIRDPAHPSNFLPAYDSGDHLHPNAAGLKAMGDGVDLGLFVRQRVADLRFNGHPFLNGRARSHLKGRSHGESELTQINGPGLKSVSVF